MAFLGGIEAFECDRGMRVTEDSGQSAVAMLKSSEAHAAHDGARGHGRIIVGTPIRARGS